MKLLDLSKCHEDSLGFRRNLEAFEASGIKNGCRTLANPVRELSPGSYRAVGEDTEEDMQYL